MLFDDLAGDRQSQTCSAEYVTIYFVQVEKAVKNARHRFWRDANAVIPEGDQNVIGLLVNGYFNSTAVWAKFNGVIEDESSAAKAARFNHMLSNMPGAICR